MRVIFLGCTKFSEEILKSVMAMEEIEIVAIFSIPKQFKISYADSDVVNKNYVDLSLYAKELEIPFIEINSVKGRTLNDHLELIESLKPDVTLVMGWYYMVGSKIRNLSKFGAWGIHASLLPNYAGGAPLVWAMINGEKETGVTLFRLSNGVDDGDIIAQSTISIEEEDTIKEVYEKATIASKKILSKTLVSGGFSFTPQDKSKIRVYPQRSPEDGKIDWTWEPERIRDFIRAQSKPYPGAWTVIGDKKVIIWSANIENI